MVNFSIGPYSQGRAEWLAAKINLHRHKVRFEAEAVLVPGQPAGESLHSVSVRSGWIGDPRYATNVAMISEAFMELLAHEWLELADLAATARNVSWDAVAVMVRGFDVGRDKSPVAELQEVADRLAYTLDVSETGVWRKPPESRGRRLPDDLSGVWPDGVTLDYAKPPTVPVSVELLRAAWVGLSASTDYITALRQTIYSSNPAHVSDVHFAKLNALSQRESVCREPALTQLTELLASVGPSPVR